MRIGPVALVLTAALAAVAACSAAVEPVQPASLAGQSCADLTAQRAEVERQRVAMNDPGATPPTAYGAFLGIFGARSGPTAKGTSEGLANERAKVIARLDTNRAALDGAIADKQCTVEARARSAGARPYQGSQYDGRYVGQGATDSWCTPPSLSLVLKGAGLSGELIDGADRYVVRGTLYDSLEASLTLKREGTAYVQDADGRLADGVLSVAMKIDASSKGCAWRFELKRQ